MAIPEISALDRGLLLDGFWAEDYRIFHCVIYDPISRSLLRWQDENAEYVIRLQGVRKYAGYTSQTVELRNPLNHQYSKITELIVEGNYPSISNAEILERRVPPKQQYFIRKQISPGSWVRVSDHIEVIISKDEEDESIRSKLLGESSELIDLAVENLPILNSEVIPPGALTFDIEVRAPRNVFPVPERAEYEVHAVGLSSGENLRRVLLLDPTSELRKDTASVEKARFQLKGKENEEFNEELSKTLDLKFFNTELELLLYLDRILAAEAILISFNGDGFDLPYIYHRMKRLGLETHIHKEGEFHWEVEGVVHLDLLQFLRKPSIRLYAFGGKYSNFTLNEISSAILGIEKVEHEDWFDTMSLTDTIRYTLKDVVITQKLFEYNNHLIWLLIILLMRLGKISFSHLIRRAISSWLLQWIAYNHYRKGYYMPPSEEILQIKGGFESSAGIEGKQYEGAIVLQPKPGVWWDVIVYDFASLYPSVIKSRNLGYDTIRCEGEGHELCKENTIPGLSHWVCTRHTSIMSSLVGYVRDLRVKWYKKLAKTETNPSKKIQYNMIQAALKVFINASYGVLGTEMFPLFCPPAAESTTAFARNALLTFKKAVEDKGAIAVYGDTDSLFLYNTTKEVMDEILFEMLILHQMELGIDYDFRVLFLTNKKKNYFGVTKTGGIIVKGLQGKKSNTPIFVRTIFNQILDIYSTIQDKADFERIRKEIIQLVSETYRQLVDRTFDLETLATQFTLSKENDEYVTKTQAVVLAIAECVSNPSFEHQIKKGLIFMGIKSSEYGFQVPNSIFPNIVEKKGDVLKASFRQSKNIDRDQVDWTYYLKTFEKIISPLISPLEINFEKEITGQMDLTSFFGGK